MRIRRLFTVLAVAAMGAVASLGTSAPALASTASFDVSVTHSSGVLVSRMTGDFRWLNQSVTITNIRQYVKGGECAYGLFDGWHDNPDEAIWLDTRTTRERCGSGSGTWFEPDDFTLAAGDFEGGINYVDIWLNDDEHTRYGRTEGRR
ncbi:hypothetical protein [Virgisporangium aliadipatigenens]|nr:hypothetical protein [Virgisporangium aliadipatigenens]